MQRFKITTVLLLVFLSTQAQEPADALRYSYFTPIGSARTQAIGGAGVSLGGDFSSTFINPAGLGQFKTNEFVFTPGFFMNRNKHSINDSSFKGNRSALNIGNIGFIFSAPNRWRSGNNRNTTIAIALTQTANFNSNFSYKGRNNISSYSEKWVEEIIAAGVTDVNNIGGRFPNGASQAYETYLVDTATENGRLVLKTNADTRFMPLYQTFNYKTRGGMYEGAFAVAWNNNEKLLYGLTVGLPFINYSRTTTVTEKDMSGNTDNNFDNFSFTENLTTTGGGINLKLGFIYKPVEHFRLGVTFHTPSLLMLTDRSDATLTANIENYSKKVNNDPSKPTTYTYTTSDYIEGDYNYEYLLVTPWRAAVSLAYVFREISDVTKQKAFITADVELVNYKANSFKSTATDASAAEEQYFKDLNASMDVLYRMAFNARIGGELKFKTFMVRGGFNYMGSPYQKSQLPEGAKVSRMIPSLGLGYRDKGYFLDLTYSHLIGRDFHVPYILTGNNYPFANNRFSNGQVVATIGFKF
ncbi:MAG TPA: hypothetical protein VFV46_00820 [Lacibacter sp.]|nr:hypothetical protein [Lacibacter sp.]